jgi:GT2 family glycosyltransferase
VNYNSGPLLARCIRALRQSVRTDSLEIIVVDNGSQDGSAQTLPEDARPDHTIFAGKNLGFAGANNLGAKNARGRYLLLINTDCFLREGDAQTLAEILDADPSVGIAGPMLRNPDNTLQPSCHNFPTPLVFLLEQSLLWKLVRHWPFGSRKLLIASDHAYRRDVDWLVGACLMVRAETFRALGGFDEAFFFYWEEADLCMRVQEAGKRVLYAPEAQAVHIGGASTPQGRMLEWFFRGLYRFYAKHYGPFMMLAIRALVRAMAYLKAGRAAALKGSPECEAEASNWLRITRI